MFDSQCLLLRDFRALECLSRLLPYSDTGPEKTFLKGRTTIAHLTKELIAYSIHWNKVRSVHFMGPVLSYHMMVVWLHLEVLQNSPSSSFCCLIVRNFCAQTGIKYELPSI